ncbi:hypothetical protein ABZ490_20800 [Streptomyces sp. NPDC005811]|uniref:hypothetical protein n=1 Tax=Streptomyces sp. NPDC005811 TaxID=3154565 RepID=UPI0033DC1574
MTQRGAWPLDEAWDWAHQNARALDSEVRRTASWLPPATEELLLAARASALSRWYPSFSHHCLRFTEGPPLWTPGGREDVREAAGFLCCASDRDGGGNGTVFLAWSGLAFRKPDPVLILTTPVAADAVHALVGLLAGEPDQQRG